MPALLYALALVCGDAKEPPFKDVLIEKPFDTYLQANPLLMTDEGAKIVRRSIHLTPFGEGFCRASLVPGEELRAELPEHASPVKSRAPQPPKSSD